MPRTTPPHAARRAFTLMELLIVIGIIAVLVGLSLVVGNMVMTGAKQRATEDTIRVLDLALQDYIAAQGENPPSYIDLPVDPTVTPTEIKWFPLADARDMSNAASSPAGQLPGRQMVNSLGYFIEAAMRVPSAKERIDKIPSKYLRKYSAGTDQALAMTAFDGWGRPIRFVHPHFQGVYATTDAGQLSPVPTTPPGIPLGIARIRRNNVVAFAADDRPAAADDVADGDGGMCVGSRPYFYSVGADGLAGVRKNASNVVEADFNKDNVYSINPNFVDK
jgi:prepilin-type N-terminal cleavage/methylation domain-containing protein